MSGNEAGRYTDSRFSHDILLLVNTPLKYYGGKQNKAEKLIALFPRHKYYIEPFVGGAAIFWRKPLVYMNILNDTNRGIYSFWYYLKNEPEQLADCIKKTNLLHEDIFKEQKKIYDSCKVSVELACATLYLITCGMSGSIGQFLVKQKNKTDKNELFANTIYEYARKLQSATILNRDALYVIEKHKHRKDALFFLDPPYVEAEKGHYDGYTHDDFEKLLKKCEEIKGSFVMTVGNTTICDDYVRKNKWHQVKENTTSTAPKQNKDFVETVVTNFEAKTSSLM